MDENQSRYIGSVHDQSAPTAFPGMSACTTKLLEAAGTECGFGYNGHGNRALLDASVHETPIKTIAVRLEDHAVHMADCYWRIKRQRVPMRRPGCPPQGEMEGSTGEPNASII